MGKYKHIELNRLLKFLKYKFKEKDKNRKMFLTILTWQDGDYFEEICNEDGGYIPKHLELFINKPLGKKYKTIDELINTIKEYSEIPYFHSVNGNYKLYYDIYLYFKEYHIIYNIYLKKCYYKKYKNILDKIIECFMDIPKWINENQLKLETYNCWNNYEDNK